jgi:CDGSH-type Zn-finger protein
MEKGKVAQKQPAEVQVQAGKSYAWCACGLSKDQPFCDGSHSKGDLRPIVFKAEKTETVYLCQCKQTNNSPHCDGSHNAL